MDTESEQWTEWEVRFLAVAQQAKTVKRGPQVGSATHYLCLYGDNGMSPEAEFEELTLMAKQVDVLKKIEVDTNYWQDTVLFID